MNKEEKLKTYNVEIRLKTEWNGSSEEDIRNQIDDEWGGFGDIENYIDIEEIKNE